MKTTISKSIKTCVGLALSFLLLCSVGAKADLVGTPTYYHNNFSGSPIAATNASGGLIWDTDYLPHGEKYATGNAATTNKVWFTGHVQDAGTGLVYMQARYYDPLIGRFYGIDSVGFVEDNPHSFNRYAYGNNNPYRYVDPDGRASKVATLIRLTADKTHEIARLTLQQAQRARRAGENVRGDTAQVAKQIESGAFGGSRKSGDLLKHEGHVLKDGSTGMPHYQTEGQLGHTFWGTLSAVLGATAVGLEHISNVVDAIPDPINMTENTMRRADPVSADLFFGKEAKRCQPPECS